ncbi:VQ motif protein [Quillaja saponaria]|uniref:VQ motif protein n=1 Tax=Quillaja saponaria TaxID=32244 RepID=A0AAD7M3S1_QUISA|nr:VQ motif protein [Quillaja saponaria]
MESTTTDKWLQFCQQSLLDGDDEAVGEPDTTLMVAESVISDSPNNSCTSTSTGQLSTPKGIGNLSKPIRRRSRATKKTPTTLLNANTTNFRALVQQFTGCPRTALSLGVHKGPITLSFRQGRSHGQQIHNHNATTMETTPFRHSNNHHHQVVYEISPPPAVQNLQDDQQQYHHHLHHRDQQQLLIQEQQNTYSSGPTLEVSHHEGFVMDNYDISNLQDLSMSIFSNEDYFM